MFKINKSEALFERAKKLFPGGVNSPVRAFKSVTGSPPFMSHADGAYMFDEDENKYLDFCCSWGPLILGHNNADVRSAIIEATSKGCTFGTPTKYGVEIGELIIGNNRFIEKMRFVSSGTEAVMSAIRLARGYTGKSKIIKFEGCYHGHVDALMVKAGSGLVTFGESTSAGIPDAFIKETLVLPLNNIDRLKEIIIAHKDDIAAVIIEPIPANNGLLIQNVDFLKAVRKVCTDQDILLIFDEVISGFRVGFEGAAGYYNIKPDIITYGKIIGGGMPVGAYGASAEIMAHIAPDGPVYQAGTLSANPVTMAAGIATMKALLTEGFYENLEEKTNYLCETVNQYIDIKGYPAKMISIGSIFWLRFGSERIITADQIKDENMAKFKILHKHLLTNGIYIGPSGYEVGFISSAHTMNDLKIFSNHLFVALDLVFDA